VAAKVHAAGAVLELLAEAEGGQELAEILAGQVEFEPGVGTGPAAARFDALLRAVNLELVEFKPVRGGAGAHAGRAQGEFAQAQVGDGQVQGRQGARVGGAGGGLGCGRVGMGVARGRPVQAGDVGLQGGGGRPRPVDAPGE